MQKALNADRKRLNPLKNIRKKVNFSLITQVGFNFALSHSEGFLLRQYN